MSEKKAIKLLTIFNIISFALIIYLLSQNEWQLLELFYYLIRIYFGG